MRPLCFPRGRQRREGFVLMLFAAGAVVMIGMFGLAVDLGRMFIVKNELQTFADASALAAIRQLDGTKTGVQGAHAAATAGPHGATTPNGWNFDTTVITQVNAKYASSFTGTYDSYAVASSPATNSYRFISVTASAAVPIYFLGVISGIPAQQNLAASATAGQIPQRAVARGGLVPFSPDAHNAADTKNFGLIPNTKYTLKWGNGNSTSCAGDAGFNPGNVPSEHGFVDLGQGNGSSSLRDVIVYGGYPNATSSPASISAGVQLGGVPGNRGASMFSATAERSAQDPDQTSTTWEQYKAAGIGNGRRIVSAPINDPAQAGGNGANQYVTIIGFANFLLHPASNISGNSGSLCATYIGPGDLSGASSGAADGTQIYTTALYQ